MFFFVLIIVIVCAILFFPIYIETNAHYDMNRRKLALGIYLYKILRIFGGYLATYNGGLAFHVSEKKAIIIPYSQVNKERKRFSIFRAFRLKSLYLTIETGAEYLLTMATMQKILETYFTLKSGHPCLYQGVLWLNNGDLLRISLQFTAYFNLGICVIKTVVRVWTFGRIFDILTLFKKTFPVRWKESRNRRKKYGNDF